MAHEYIHPDGMAPTNAFTPVVVAAGSKIIYVSGQVPVDGDGNIVGDDLASQAEQVFKNLQTCLAAAGATFADVTKTMTFVVDFKPEHRAIIGEVREKFLPPGNRPASTLLGVQALARPGLLIEIEATAVI